MLYCLSLQHVEDINKIVTCYHTIIDNTYKVCYLLYAFIYNLA
jgi:hypothetical protein